MLLMGVLLYADFSKCVLIKSGSFLASERFGFIREINQSLTIAASESKILVMESTDQEYES